MDTRLVEIAARLQTFSHDYDGNLTGDGVVDYQWDAENRLIRMETTTTAQSWGFPHRLLEFRYDYLGRRVQKRVLVIDGSASTEVLCRRYRYDGWNLVAEYAAPDGAFCGALLRSYTWGLDIVSTLADAGGVGALLQIADHPSGKTYLPAYDGNGNITALFNAGTGAVAAVYEYGPFGEPLRAQTLDATVADNPWRFSTKWTDLDTGLVYYGRRYYDPKNGRFINRDPIEEAGGINLYGFCGNDAINHWDVLGNLRLYNLEGDPMEEIADGEPIPAGRWSTPTGGFDSRNGGWGLPAGTIDPHTGQLQVITVPTPEDPNTVEGRPHVQLGVGNGPYYGNTMWTGTAVYSSVGYNGNGVGSPSSPMSMGRPVPTKNSQNNPTSSGYVEIGRLQYQDSNENWRYLDTGALAPNSGLDPNLVGAALANAPLLAANGNAGVPGGVKSTVTITGGTATYYNPTGNLAADGSAYDGKGMTGAVNSVIAPLGTTMTVTGTYNGITNTITVTITDRMPFGSLQKGAVVDLSPTAFNTLFGPGTATPSGPGRVPVVVTFPGNNGTQEINLPDWLVPAQPANPPPKTGGGTGKGPG